ncbi:hypothetical protein niasHT_016930 [Heterodera trifolii]|uniref:BTB domain-containing protein n=1 Tax=Heterodera trifolii TaxID=157864 RepID=A0ABD2L3C2_9BILA
MSRRRFGRRRFVRRRFVRRRFVRRRFVRRRFGGDVSTATFCPAPEAAAFKVMLSFIYTDDLSGLNGDNAMAVLCAAKKYNIPGLVDPSLQIPISKLRNVFVAYAYACLFDLKVKFKRI